MYGFVFRTNKVEVCGKKCRPIVDTTIVESRHHAITPFLVSDEGGGRGGGARGKGLQILDFLNGTLERAKKILKAASV